MGRLINVAIFLSAIGGTYVAFKPAIDKGFAVLQQDINYIINKANGTTPHVITAKILADPLQGPSPLKVNFTSNPSGGTSPYKYAWDFGDGQTSTDANPNHTFTSPGHFTVKLSVTDSKNQTATDSVIVAPGQVTPPPPPPGPTQPPTTTPYSVDIFNIQPNPLTDGQVGTLGVSLTNGSGQFIGGIQWGDGKGETIHFDGWDATLTHTYNLGNTADKTLDAVLSIIDEITQQTVIKHLSLTVKASSVAPPPPPGPGPVSGGLNIVLAQPVPTVYESGDFVRCTIAATNRSSSPQVFKIIMQINGPKGEAITINSIGINPLNAGATQSFLVQSSFIPLSYIGQKLTIEVFAWDNNNVAVADSTTAQVTF